MFKQQRKAENAALGDAGDGVNVVQAECKYCTAEDYAQAVFKLQSR